MRTHGRCHGSLCRWGGICVQSLEKVLCNGVEGFVFRFVMDEEQRRSRGCAKGLDDGVIYLHCHSVAVRGYGERLSDCDNESYCTVGAFMCCEGTKHSRDSKSDWSFLTSP